MSEPREVEPLEGVVLDGHHPLTTDGRDLDIQQREAIGLRILQQMRESA